MMMTKEIKNDVRKASENMGREEARYLVDTYYQIQEYRKSTRGQCRSANVNEPTSTLDAIGDGLEELEAFIKSCLDRYIKAQPIGQWLQSICGIGPVISAGLIANIDIRKVQTAGQIQAFAGLDPTREWKKGEKRPYNARLKTLCWKIGESFVKVSNNDKDFYGKIYKARKAYEQEKNEHGDYADQAKAKLEKFKIGKTTEAYKWYSEGKLPPAHIQERAKRYAVKLFLSHLFEAWYRMEHKTMPPKPYAISILNHAHYIEIPNVEIVKQYER